MDNLWTEFRIYPTTYLQTHRTNVETLITTMRQTLTSDQEKNEQIKLTVLGIWQEMPNYLFSDSERLDDALTTLKNAFLQQKNSSNALFLSQVLCTIATLLIEMEQQLPGHNQRLKEFVMILFNVIEKVKTDSNRMLKSIACDCLRELEMNYPGLLSSKVGHFYGMSLAENSYIHQNYIALFAIVLEHAVQKYLLDLSEPRSPSSLTVSNEDIADLLSYSDPLKSFTLGSNFKDQAASIMKDPPIINSEDIYTVDLHEVKRGVSFVLDYFHLFTPSCLISTVQRLVSCVQSSSLSPKLLKRLFHYSSCFNLELFQLVLLLRLKFGSAVCDEGEERNLKNRLFMMAGQHSLLDYHRALLYEWLLHWPKVESFVSESVTSSSDGEVEEIEKLSLIDEEEIRRKAITPSVFDSLNIFFYKCKALCSSEADPTSGQPSSSTSISELVVNVLQLVEYDIGGPPAVTLYRVMYTFYAAYCHQQHTIEGREVGRLALALVMKHPQFVPNTIDFIKAVQNYSPQSPVPLNLLAAMTQHLATTKLSLVLSHLQLYLTFIEHAATHLQINPLVLLQLLKRVLSESSLCERGSWEIGNSLLEVCTSVMRIHHTEAVFKDLCELLQLIAQKFNDLEIQDRACFYHQLLLTVSRNKLSVILASASNSAGASLTDIIEARIANSLFPSAPPVREIVADPCFLTLHRLDNTITENAYNHTKGNSDEEIDKESLVSGYLENLENENSSSLIPIHLKFTIRFSKRPEGVSPRIYALVLKFSTSGPYHPSPDVYIPYLAVDSNGTTQTSSGSKVVTVTVYPKEPFPAKFNVNAVFSTEEGTTCTTQLPPISVEFKDIFQPLPKHVQEKAPVNGIFSALWDYISKSQKGHSPSTVEGRYGVLSTLHLDLSNTDWEVCSQTVRDLEVITESENNQESGVHRVMVFLPPCYHLLLKFTMEDSSTTVLMATDNWRLLPLANTFLQTIKSS